MNRSKSRHFFCATIALLGIDLTITACKEPPRSSKYGEDVATVADKLAMRFVATANMYGLEEPWVWEKNPDACQTTIALGQVGSMVKTTTGAHGLSYTGFDPLFQKYEACSGMSWKVLKALAKMESELNPNAQNKSTGHVGLFQISQKMCYATLADYGLQERCTDLTNPETGVIYASIHLSAAMKTIEAADCQIDRDELLYFLYISFGYGEGFLADLLKEAKCDRAQTKKAMMHVWQKRFGGNR